MLTCTVCGSVSTNGKIWFGGSYDCDHFFKRVEPPEHLVDEIKLLMTVYSPGEIIEAARRLAGGGA